jgi:hypothetical protein
VFRAAAFHHQPPGSALGGVGIRLHGLFVEQDLLDHGAEIAADSGTVVVEGRRYGVDIAAGGVGFDQSLDQQSGEAMSRSMLK